MSNAAAVKTKKSLVEITKTVRRTTSRLLCRRGELRVALVEFLDAPGRVDELLFAREEGVTRGADFEFLDRLRRAHLIGRSAGALNRSNLKIGVNALFHESMFPFISTIG